MKIKIKAFCKVNFFLEITGKLSNSSYHTIESVMKTVALSDEIQIEENNKPYSKINGLGFKDNSILKSTNLFLKEAKSSKGFLISCRKNIPSGAGLGGASADAAATLLGLNKVFNNKFTKEELCKIGKKIGADVPFCLEGGCKLVSGIGDKIENINWNFNVFLVIVKPKFSISTREAYKKFDKLNIKKIKNLKPILEAIKKNDMNKFCKNLFNRFEEVLNIDEIFKLKEKFINNGASASLLSGSGSCVFGIFEDEKTAKKCFLKFKKTEEEVFLTKPV